MSGAFSDAAPGGRALRIAVVANTSWYLYNFRRNLMRALAADGHAVIAVGGDGEFARRLVAEGFGHRSVAFTGSGTHPLREFATVVALRPLLARERIDVALSFTPKGNIYTALALQGLPGALVMNVSGLGTAFTRGGLLAVLSRLLYRITVRRAAWVFFQNEEDQRQFREAGLLDDERTMRLPGSGVDLSAFQPPAAARAKGGDDALFIMVARLLWNKGVAEFVGAARIVKLHHAGARFRLLGALAPEHQSGVPPAVVDGWVREGLIEYPGAVDDVRPHLIEADCVVLPSYREGLPRALLEAAACARPVIAADSIGCRDPVDDGITGFLCKTRDAEDLARQMLRLLAMSDADRRSMGAAGRAKMEREFDEGRVIDAYRHRVGRLAGATGKA